MCENRIQVVFNRDVLDDVGTIREMAVYEPSVMASLLDVADLHIAIRRPSGIGGVVIQEGTIPELLHVIDPQFIRHGVRVKELPADPEFVGVYDGIMVFRILSSDSTKHYIENVKFDEWDIVGKDPELTWDEKARLLLDEGNVRLHCTCPAFLYWGYQYILTIYDSAIRPMTIRPEIRNPGERGAMCKHMHKTLSWLVKHPDLIARELKKEFGGE